MISYLLAVIFLVLAIIYVVMVYIPKKDLQWHKKSYEALGYKVKVDPFKPLSLGAFGQLLDWQRKYGDFFYKVKAGQFAQYDIWLTSFLTKTQVIIIKPNLIKAVLVPEHPFLYHKAPYIAQNTMRLLGNGITWAQGEDWKRKRKVITKSYNHDFLVSLTPIFKKLFDQVADQIQKKCSHIKPENNVFQIQLIEIFTQIIGRMILKNFFGSEWKINQIQGSTISQYMQKFVGAFNKQSCEPLPFIFGAWVNNLGLTFSHRQINRKIRLFRHLAKDFIDQRIQKIEKSGYSDIKTDVLENLLKQMDQQNKNKPFRERFDIKQLIDEFLSIYKASIDTTSEFTLTLIYLISINLRVQQKLRAQIDKHIKTEEDINFLNLKKITYIDWIQNQTLRVYGPAPILIPRRSTKDHKINDIPIRKGDQIQILGHANHYNPEIFPNPLLFNPERWQSQCDNIHSYALFSFSFGPRSCIGKQFALLANKVILVKFMKRYKKIKLPSQNFKYVMKFLYSPQDFKTTIQKAQ